VDGFGCYNEQSYPFTSFIFSYPGVLAELAISIRIDNEPSFEGIGIREA
jgi:hypothetical protein